MGEIMKKILTAVNTALSKYSEENIDVVLESGKLTVMYHSDNNSFPVSEDFPDIKNKGKLEKELDKLGVGHCW